MNKIGAIVITAGAVIAVYVIMLVTVPILADFVASANATAANVSDMSRYPGSAGFLTSIPWVAFFIPGALGIVVIISILRQP